MNNSYRICTLLCIVFLLSTSAFSANATTITFDLLPVFNDAGGHLSSPDQFAYEEGGYRIVDPTGIVYVGTLHAGWASAGNSTAVFNNAISGKFTLTRIDAAEFVLHSIVLSKLNVGTGPSTVNIVGHLPFGGTFLRTVILPDVAGTVMILFTPSWNRLVSVEFRLGGSGARFQLDDINVTLNTVPTHETTWGHIKALYED